MFQKALRPTDSATPTGVRQWTCDDVQHDRRGRAIRDLLAAVMSCQVGIDRACSAAAASIEAEPVGGPVFGA